MDAVNELRFVGEYHMSKILLLFFLNLILLELALVLVVHNLHQGHHIGLQLDLDEVVVHTLIHFAIEDVFLPLLERLVDIECPLPVRYSLLILLNQLYFAANNHEIPLLSFIHKVNLLAFFVFLNRHKVS